MASPRGVARGSASAILGMPVLAEKRTVTGTSCLKCNALLTLAASALGTNLPSRTTPLAWAARCVVCLPNAELSASTNDSGVVVAIAGSFRYSRRLMGCPQAGIEAYHERGLCASQQTGDSKCPLRVTVPHQQAGHMTAPDQCCINVKKLWCGSWGYLSLVSGCTLKHSRVSCLLITLSSSSAPTSVSRSITSISGRICFWASSRSCSGVLAGTGRVVAEPRRLVMIGPPWHLSLDNVA